MSHRESVRNPRFDALDCNRPRFARECSRQTDLTYRFVHVAHRSFATPEEEARYYRVLSKDLQDELEDLKLALSEFQSSSKELEDEMEKELANTERREAELRHEAERLRSDVDSWKVRV